MPLILSEREAQLTELMDNPRSDRALLFRTYNQFKTVNNLISGWRRVFLNYILPLTKPGGTYTLLDIGFGGGDIVRKIHRLALKHDRLFNITGIETDSRAMDYVHEKEWPVNVRFRGAETGELVCEGQAYDFIISNHLLHHLRVPEIIKMLSDCEKLCKRRTIHNDIERSDLAYMFFNPLSRLYAGNSFLNVDGLRSIRKSFTVPELTGIIPENWDVRRMFPYRLLLVNGQI